MPQSKIILGGEANLPLLHIASANGFVPQVYLPLLRPFMDRYHVFSLPPRALWGDGLPPPVNAQTSWRSLADDLLAAFAQYDVRDVVALGHSFGGVASLLALLQSPQLFKALILLDPTILTHEIIAMQRVAQTQGLADQHPLALGAAHRRRTFESVQEAYARFRDRSIFADWDDEALRLYAEYGTSDASDGTRTLSWLPEWEAYYFSNAYTEIWEDLPRLNDVDVPMLIIGGGVSDTFVPETAATLREMLPRATHISIPGHGHLFPQSAPQETAQVIADWLAKL